MYVPDFVLYVLIFIGGFVTFLIAIAYYEDDSEDPSGLIFANTIARIMIVPMISVLFWGVFTGMSLELNNCVSVFASCFTSPTFVSTTGTQTTADFSIAVAYLGFGMFLIMVILTGANWFLALRMLYQSGAVPGTPSRNRARRRNQPPAIEN